MNQSNPKKFMLTREGLLELQGEYDQLVNKDRLEVVERIQRAREFGDLAENSEYDAAKEAQTLLETRIGELEEVLHKFQLIDQEQATDFVVIGSTVKVEMNDELHEFTIVGSMEADPAEKKISNDSPVGKAILGLKEGELTEVVIGPVKSEIRVVEIR